VGLCPIYDSGGNRRAIFGRYNTHTSNAQRDGRLRDCALASAQIIQFAPYLARKQEQHRFLARRIRHSLMVEGDIRAWVA